MSEEILNQDQDQNSPLNYKYHLYIIFHKTLFRECYKELSEETFRKVFTCYGVNGKIHKDYDEWFKPSVLEERTLAVYDPFLQYNKFCESSAYYHMHMNWSRMVEPYDFIGAIQYDMRVGKKTIESIENKLSTTTNPESVIFYHYLDTAYDHLGSSMIDEKLNINYCIGGDGWAMILNLYNHYFQTNIKFLDVVYGKIPLFHTFMVHKKVFAKAMLFVRAIVPRMFELLHFDVRHLPFHLERLFGVIFLCMKLEGNLTDWVLMEDLIHDENIKDLEWKDTLIDKNQKVINQMTQRPKTPEEYR